MENCCWSSYWKIVCNFARGHSLTFWNTSSTVLHRLPGWLVPLAKLVFQAQPPPSPTVREYCLSDLLASVSAFLQFLKDAVKLLKPLAQNQFRVETMVLPRKHQLVNVWGLVTAGVSLRFVCAFPSRKCSHSVFGDECVSFFFPGKMKSICSCKNPSDTSLKSHLKSFAPFIPFRPSPNQDYYITDLSS